MGAAPGHRRSTILTAAALAVLAAAVYARSLGGGFLNWDDNVYVTTNEEVRLPFGEAVRTVFTTFLTANWNPLQRLSYVVEWKLSGGDPFLFRLDNLVLHAACSVLVLLVLAEWLGNRTVAGFAAAAFAVHPANVENVAWISERKTLLASLFAFAAVLAWQRARGARGLRTLAVVLFAVGLLAKTSIVVLPLLLFLLDVTRRPGADAPAGAAPAPRPAWGWFVAMVLVSLPACWLQVRAAAADDTIRPLHGGTVWTHAATCVAALPKYVGSVIAPFALVPRHHVVPVTSAADPRFLLGLGLAAVLAVGTWRSWRGGRRLAVAAPWFVASVLLTVVVPIPIVHADRYLYLSLPFLLGGAAGWAAERLDGARVRFPWVASAAVAVLGACAAVYAENWKTSTTLWTCQVERHPKDLGAWHSLAVAQVTEAGDARGARHCYEYIVSVDPLYPDAPEGIALLDLSDGRPADAERRMAALVAKDPRRSLAWSVLAAAREQAGRPAESKAALVEGLRHLPESRDLAENLARFLERNPALASPGDR